ncbi:hypothetical protein MMC26_005784 [Xylographa opegraphella]|nr:hypothetical protein [Xylographa opegraphella]
MSDHTLPAFFSKIVGSPPSSEISKRKPQSLISSAFEVEHPSHPSACTIPSSLPTRSIAQRRSPQANLPKLVVREGPPAAEALPAHALNQPHLGDLTPPTAPLTPPPSLPIAIPLPRHENTSRPTTPLTAREDKGGTYFPFFETTPKRPQISQSLRPSYQRPRSRGSHDFVPSTPHKQYLSKERNFPPRPEAVLGTSSQSNSMPSERMYTPSSPLSPTMASSSSVLAPAGPRTPASGRRGKDLQLPPLPLPRFHPLNYAIPEAEQKNTILRTATINRPPRSPQLHHRQLSNAQQKLKSYQRELLTNASRASLAASMASSGPDGKETPKAPSLLPRGSPGPATPLMLEDGGDYMTGGGHGLMLGEGSPREHVDKLIRYENERRMGFHSGTSSPAVSPAGGRG